MNQCLITKLKASVNDDSLLKLGEMRFHLNLDNVSSISYIERGMNISVSEEMDIECLSGNFVNADGLTNLGTILHLNAKQNQIYLSNDAVVSIPNKYKVTKFLNGYFYSFAAESRIITEINVEDLNFSDVLTLSLARGSYGDAQIIFDKSNLENLYISYSDVTGNISNCLSLKKIYIRNSGVANSLDDFAKLINLEEIEIRNCSLASGNKSFLNFANMVNLRTIVIFDCENIYGDLNAFIGLPNLTTIKMNIGHVTYTEETMTALTDAGVTVLLT